MASPGNFIVEAKENLWYCMVCHCYFTTWDSILDHVNQQDHDCNVQTCGNDILQIGPNHQYYCSICDRLISGYLNVYIHINGRKHINYYQAMEGDMEADEQYEEEQEEEEAEEEDECNQDYGQFDDYYQDQNFKDEY